MGELRRVGSVSELRRGKPLAAEVSGRRVAIFSVGDAIVATAGKCPHAGGPLHEGEIDGTTLSCPWHGWSYDLQTGACEEDPETQLEMFEVHVDGDEIFVRI